MATSFFTARSDPPEQMMRRGVYRAPYLVNGHEVLIAIDSHAVARKHLKLTLDVDEEVATAFLRDLLDRLDPLPQRPRLDLVRNVPSEPAGRARPARDAPLQEKRAYWRSLVETAAGKVHVYV